MTRIIMFNLLLLGSCGYAIWRGGAPERITGWLLIAAAVLTAIAPPTYQRLALGMFAVDLLLLVALLWIALRADRFWPLILAAMQLDTTVVHLLKLVDADLIRFTYAIMIAMWSYPMLVILAIGTARHRARLQRFGEDRAWSASIA